MIKTRTKVQRERTRTVSIYASGGKCNRILKQAHVKVDILYIL